MREAAMNLTNHFLIAMPSLSDPNFSRTVTYLCSHDEDGAMGIVINRPLGVTLGEMLGQMGISATHANVQDIPVLQGGPVLPERGFVLHRPASTWDAVLEVADTGVAVATSRDILQAIALGDGPTDVVVALGYAGWAAGQLEDELGANAWLSGPADQNIIFEAPHDQRWSLAARTLGVEIEHLSNQAGHA
jgi:putative transcriptional regulator